MLTAPSGRPFTLAVRDAVRDAQADDPLRAVTVVVPSNLAGLSLRRLLGSGLLDDTPQLGPQGIANVSFATPFQFASTIAANRLAEADIRPLTTAVLAAAVRHVLRVDPGRFEAVAQHTATETALVRAYAEITTLSAERRAELAAGASERVAALVGFVDAVSAHLADNSSGVGYHDEAAVFAAATSLLSAGAVARGSLVLAGPLDPNESSNAFLAAAAAAHETTALVALTGDGSVDPYAIGSMEPIVGAALRDAPSADLRVPTRMIPAADADEEVRAVARQVLALAHDGDQFDRMAVFTPSQDPYARTIREQFEASGIPTAGPDHRTLGDSMAGRLLRRILALGVPGDRDDHFTREGVLSLVAAAPVRGPDGKRVRSGAWENLSRSAGVLGGLDDWNAKLARHDQNLAENADDPRNAERADGFFEALRRERAATAALNSFVTWIHERTVPAAVGTTWEHRSNWAGDLLADLLPQSNRRTSWPDTEIDAAERIEVILRRVGVLDGLEPGAPYAAFVRAVELELDAPSGSRGRFGTGVLVAPLAAAPGLDLDHIFIVGLSEGVCPRPLREDTLLPDADRLVLETQSLPVRDDRLRDQRRQFLTALASGSVTRTLVMPLGDHRSGRVRTPSRWWIEALRTLGAPEHITSQTWTEHPLPQLEQAGSFTQTTIRAATSGLALSPAELQLHTTFLTSAPHPDDRVANRNAAMEVDSEAGFCRFTGDLGAVDLPSVVTPERPMSATRLETWASCPRRYFFAQVLGLGVIEPPDRISEISALERGSLWHAILEDFIREALPGAPHEPSSPGAPWTDDDRLRLHAHAHRRFAEFEEKGVTGRPLLWAIDRENILADLDQFLREDNELRAEFGSSPRAVELAIGMDRVREEGEVSDGQAAAAVFTLPDGRELPMRGFADRVDRRGDGSPVVLDYKTGGNMAKKMGKRKKLATFLREDPVLAGTKLQLGVYAEAAQQHYGADRSSAWYWFTSEKGGFERAGYPWTTPHRERFTQTLHTIVSGIESGLYPPNPGDYDSYWGSHDNCGFCDFNDICPQRREDEFADAKKDLRLADYLAMIEPPAFDEPEGESS